MRLTTEIGTAPLTDLVKQVQAGNEVLLTQGNKPVARLVPAAEKETVPQPFLHLTTVGGKGVRPGVNLDNAAALLGVMERGA